MKKLKDILTLWATKRRGEDIKETFLELKNSFKKEIEKIVLQEDVDYHSLFKIPFSAELFEAFTEFSFSVKDAEGKIIEAKSLKELKGMDCSEYEFKIKMKEGEPKEGEFLYYRQWWKNKTLESVLIEKFILSTSLGFDFCLQKNLLQDKINESEFHIKHSKNLPKNLKEEAKFINAETDLNATNLPSWIKKIDLGKFTIIESSLLEKKLNFIGEKLRGEYKAKRCKESDDFWILEKVKA